MNLTFPQVIYFWVILIASWLWLWSPLEMVSLAEQINQNSCQAIATKELKELEKRDIIYLGENHISPEDHIRQLEIITQLHSSNSNAHKQLAIGMEMFQRPFQPILNRYLAGKITEEELRQQTEYDLRWVYDWEFYAPILRYARQNQIPIIALNTPSEITQKVAKSGISSLSVKDFRYIPPQAEIDLENQEYRQKTVEIYLQHLQEGQGNSKALDNFFSAQVLWDETMAEAIAKYYFNHPQSQIIVLTGKAHVMNSYAIPERVTRRINRNFSSIIVDLNSQSWKCSVFNITVDINNP